MSEAAFQRRLGRERSHSTSAESLSHTENHRKFRPPMAVLWSLHGLELMQADQACDEDLPGRIFRDEMNQPESDDKIDMSIISPLLFLRE